MEALAAKGVWSDLEPDPGLAPHLRQVPERPDDPAPEQADAWGGVGRAGHRPLDSVTASVAWPNTRPTLSSNDSLPPSVRSADEPAPHHPASAPPSKPLGASPVLLLWLRWPVSVAREVRSKRTSDGGDDGHHVDLQEHLSDMPEPRSHSER